MTAHFYCQDAWWSWDVLSPGVSIKTVGAHIEYVYFKTGVRSRTVKALFAMRHGLVG